MDLKIENPNYKTHEEAVVSQLKTTQDVEKVIFFFFFLLSNNFSIDFFFSCFLKNSLLNDGEEISLME